MTDRQTDKDELDLFFQAAKRTAPTLSDAALARMTAQALDVQAGFAAPKVTRPAARGGRLSQLFATLGGWPAMASLATAGVAGLWIGVMPPAALETLAMSIGATSSVAEDDLYLVDPLPGYVLSLDLGDGS